MKPQLFSYLEGHTGGIYRDFCWEITSPFNEYDTSLFNVSTLNPELAKLAN